MKTLTYNSNHSKNMWQYFQFKITNLKTIITLLLITLNFIFSTNSFAQQTVVDSLKQVIATSKQDTNKVKALNTLAVKYQRINLDTSLIYAEQSLDLAQQLNYKIGMAIAYRSIGLVYVYQNNYSKTLEYWQKSLKINKEIGNKLGIARNLTNIGNVYEEQNNFSKALEYQQKSLKIFEELSNKKGLAITIGNIGNVYIEQGNYPKAIEYMQKAMVIYRELGDEIGVAINLGNIGVVYADQRNYPKAIEYYNRSLKIRAELGNKEGVANNLINIGAIYQRQNNYPKAIEYYQKALKIYEELGGEYGVASILGNIGVIYKMEDNYPKAIEYYNKSLKIFEELGVNSGIAKNLGNIGSLYKNKKEYKKAIDYLNKSIIINKEIGIVDNNQYRNISISYWGVNNKIEACNNFNNVLNIDNKNILLNFSILSENAKQLYFTGIEKDYWVYNSFVLQNTDSFPNMVETVYNNTVKNKGLLLKSNTAMRNAIYASNDSILIQDYDNWIVLKTQIAEKYSNGEDATVLENKADSLETNLVQNSNEFSDFKKVQNIDWKQVQNSLKENEVAIEFVHFDFFKIEWTDSIMYCALIVTPNSQYPEMIPLFEQKQLEAIIGKFGGNNYNYINSIYGKNDEVNTQLYNLIWKPMENALKGAKKVYISPDGLLHKISFPAIAKEQDVYLCDAYDIEVKSTTGKIASGGAVKTIHESSQPTTATIFGGINYDTDSTSYQGWTYLEGTQTETQKIDKILKKGKVEVNYFTSSNATEGEFKQLASNSNILHIATHGFFYPDPKDVVLESDTMEVVEDITFRGGSRGFGVNSFVENNNPLMRSGLVFAGANDVWSKQNKTDSIDDGVLTAQEVANIDMRKTNLVVMSACETGLGDIKGSEGVYGLQRAFKMAGVNYMIMSLWQVPDKETEEFMTKFYKKLIKQNNIKQAFAETQKEMRKKYDPYFWAAFVLIE